MISNFVLQSSNISLQFIVSIQNLRLLYCKISDWERQMELTTKNIILINSTKMNK